MSDLFNEKAKDWDANEMKRLISSKVGSSIIKHVPLQQQMDVMDFGAGTGLISTQVVPFVNKIIAVDISKAMLEKLVSKPELLGKVEAVCQDITDKPIDAQFDVIMSAMALHHVEDTKKLINTFYDHLKPGAKIALADLDKEDGSFHPKGTEGVFHSGFERNELQALLESNGFKDVQLFTAHIINVREKQYPVFLVIATKC
ncbi:class I SAM-dependent methyltransferase [Candidatus Colwellia aromaticivorans]|uniref:class I SAM-dependent methyltransferase n=1 Tax=Candidatus Colwellia aromaticivorans TaxID=2267621 RepID=UPI000DF1F22F|nr:class I SAM-dependent methyltransferase [Candidatus Colwellia aromaticivorans]